MHSLLWRWTRWASSRDHENDSDPFLSAHKSPWNTWSLLHILALSKASITFLLFEQISTWLVSLHGRSDGDACCAKKNPAYSLPPFLLNPPQKNQMSIVEFKDNMDEPLTCATSMHPIYTCMYICSSFDQITDVQHPLETITKVTSGTWMLSFTTMASLTVFLSPSKLFYL